MKQGQWAQADLNAMLNAIQAGAPNADVLLIGSTPDSSSNTAQIAANQIIQSTAKTYQGLGLNALYWDGFTPLGSWARVNALGIGGDGTHLPWQAQQFLAGLMLRDLGIFHGIGGLSPFNINAANAYVNGNMGIGTMAPTQILDVVSATGATASIRNTGTSGQTAKLNLISGFSGTNGDASIQATGAELRVHAGGVGGTGNIATIYTANRRTCPGRQHRKSIPWWHIRAIHHHRQRLTAWRGQRRHRIALHAQGWWRVNQPVRQGISNRLDGLGRQVTGTHKTGSVH